ncbi:MAG: PHP-associated domain-containing protein [Nanoarchaeota archaeon]
MELSKPGVFFERPQPEVLSRVGWMGMDLHFHTEYSFDSIAGLDATLRLAKKMGIGLAMTDHNAVGGALRYSKNRHGVPVIPGIELTGKEGTHMIYYFYSARELEAAWKKEIKPYLPNPYIPTTRPTLEMLRDLSKYNCVITAPHPYSPGVVGIKKLTDSDRDLRAVHCVEVINGYNLHGLNLRAIKWRERCGKGATGGTDGHMVEELGRVATFCPASNVEEFLDALKKKQSVVIGEEDRTLRKIVITLLKEHELVSKSREYHIAKKLLQGQFHSSNNYYNKKYGSLKRRLNLLFGGHHKEPGFPKKADKRHPLGGSWTRSEQFG